MEDPVGTPHLGFPGPRCPRRLTLAETNFHSEPRTELRDTMFLIICTGWRRRQRGFFGVCSNSTTRRRLAPVSPPESLLLAPLTKFLVLMACIGRRPAFQGRLLIRFREMCGS